MLPIHIGTGPNFTDQLLHRLRGLVVLRLGGFEPDIEQHDALVAEYDRADTGGHDIIDRRARWHYECACTHMSVCAQMHEHRHMHAHVHAHTQAPDKCTADCTRACMSTIIDLDGARELEAVVRIVVWAEARTALGI